MVASEKDIFRTSDNRYPHWCIYGKNPNDKEKICYRRFLVALKATVRTLIGEQEGQMVFDKFHGITMLTTFAVVVITVMIHYEGLHYFTNWMSHNRLKPRFRIVVLIYGLLILHAVEIFIFGVALWALSQSPGYGTLITADVNALGDYVYFSSTVYSTLGFGDLVTTGPIRFMAGIESVTGLLLITWSASFTYLEMVRYWRNDD
jgi:hypothetical protein